MSGLRLPTVGDRVLYTYANHDLDANHKHLEGESRPAVIVRDFSSGHPSQIDPTVPRYNLIVFTDGENDGLPDVRKLGSRQLSATPTPGKFHWPRGCPHVAHADHTVPGFEFEHLPERPCAVAKAFRDLAWRVLHGDRHCSETGLSTFGEALPDNQERQACFLALLTARNAAICAIALKEDGLR